MRQRPGHKLVTWWLPVELLARLKTYQHQHHLDSLVEAARWLLEAGLAAEDCR